MSILNLAYLLFFLVLSSCALPPKVSRPSEAEKISISYRLLQTESWTQVQEGPQTHICYFDTYDPSIYKMPSKFKEALDRNAFIRDAHTVKMTKTTCYPIRDPLSPPLPSTDQFQGRNNDYYVDFIMHTGPWMVDEDSLNAWTFARAFASLLTLTIIPYSEKMRMRVLAVVYDKNLNLIGTYFQYTKSSFHLWLPYIFHPEAKNIFSYGLKSPVIDKTLNQIFIKLQTDLRARRGLIVAPEKARSTNNR